MTLHNGAPEPDLSSAPVIHKVDWSDPCLAVTAFLDHDSPEIAEFVAKAVGHPDRATALAQEDPRTLAVKLFYAVRDGLFYEIYNADFARPALKASAILRRRTGLCIHKSIVYAAALRHVGIPSKIWLTDVKNHLCSPKLEAMMGTRVFHFHALVVLKLDGQWRKATPVFNARLCQLYGMTPLEFDGHEDCVHHAYDSEGRTYMEFLADHGTFTDLPYDLLLTGLREKHGALFATDTKFRSGSLIADAK
ncbi:transglutaminase family protein [Aliiroseovarius crassostreae]|uniref:transglutaminase-like domain-containing protein n=1 Tax=Aliiroseovarius crassostreae TaxID=154981 RepID=UPI0021FF107F|nr:transglutaminase family protein [Aliiroseovarius crassostreae]UWQ06655.1 transglutaminase family protein [Aliiroseovarius crassostreae]